MDVLTTLERLRPDDEFIDDDVLEHIWSVAIVRVNPERTHPGTDHRTVELPLGVAVRHEQRPRHRRLAFVGVAAALILVVAGLTVMRPTRPSAPTDERSQQPSSPGASPMPSEVTDTDVIVGLVLPSLPAGLALVGATPPTTRDVPSPYQVRVYGSAEEPTDPTRMVRVEYAESRAMAIPCHSFLSLSSSDGAVAYTADQWRAAASPVDGSTTFDVSGTTGASCVDPSGVLQAGWFTGDIGVNLTAGSAVTADQLIAFANSLTTTTPTGETIGRPPVDLVPDPLPSEMVVLVGDDVPFAQRVTETSWAATPNGVDGVPGNLVVQSWIGVDEQGLFAKRAPINAEPVAVRGHQGYRWAPPQRSDLGPLEIEVWWEEAPGLVISIRSSELFEIDGLMTLVEQLIPATSAEFAAFIGTTPAGADSTEASPIDSTNMVIDPPPPGNPFRTDLNSSMASLRIYAQPRPDPENGPWMLVGWTSQGVGSAPMIGETTKPDLQFFDGGRGYAITQGIDPAEVRRLINGATVEPDGRRSIDPSKLPDGLELTFDGDSVSDVGRRPRDGAASEVAWWADPANGPFVRLLVATDPDMSGWRAGRVGFLDDGTAVTDAVVGSHPAYLRSLAGVRVLSWHDGSRWLQLIASNASDDELLRMAATVRQADPEAWVDIRLADDTDMLGEVEQATVGPPGSDTTPILDPTTIGSIELPDRTVLSITAADFGTLTLSGDDGFVIYTVSAGATGAVGRAMRVTSDVSPAAATGDLVYGIAVAGSTITIRDDATGEEVPVSLSDSTKPVNGFIGFAARLPISTTYATMTITDPITGAKAESRIGY
jgi:hypothetical protein